MVICSEYSQKHLQTPVLSASNYSLHFDVQCLLIVGLVFSTCSRRRWCA